MRSSLSFCKCSGKSSILIKKNYTDKDFYSYLKGKYPDVDVYVDRWVIDAVKTETDTLPLLFQNSDEAERRQMDLIIALGGDGTILWASKQFHQGYMPPLVSFSLGSYGYLCNFMFDEHPEVLDSIMNPDGRLNLDERLRLRVAVPGQPERDIYRGNDLTPTCRMTVDGYHILNELVVDRGPSPYAIQVEIDFDGQYMTTMVGDGLIVATPSGSTAYNLSAGGSIVQSNTECICVTPLAPHSLSFRPVVLPASTRITLRKPKDKRNSAWVSLDGATRFELRDGEELHLEAADAKLAMVIETNDMMKQWSNRLVHMLNWNRREPQKPLTTQLRADANEEAPEECSTEQP